MKDPYFATGKDDPDLTETSWPIPGPRLDEVEWRLRYAPQESLTRGDILIAAEVIAAYGALLMKSSRDQRKYGAALSRVMRERAAARDREQGSP